MTSALQVVAGLSLKNLHPRVWDPASPYFLKQLTGIMVSYADFKQMPARRRMAMRLGLRKYLNLPNRTSIYLDNGAFYFATNGGEPSADEYRTFVQRAKPDWRPIRFDAIPAPSMSPRKQRECFDRTMGMNYAYQHDGFVPVVHAGKHLDDYLHAVASHPKLSEKECIALGGMVPNLLRTPKAATFGTILDTLIAVRLKFPQKKIHVFGIGGTATLHLAGVLRFDSIDSSGWRNRAARGIVQLPGSGERIVANLGKWRGKELSPQERTQLRDCPCPACQLNGLKGLKADGLVGFSNRATHNLWVLLDEARWVRERLKRRTYERCYKRRLNNTIYLPLIAEVLRRINAR